MAESAPRVAVIINGRPNQRFTSSTAARAGHISPSQLIGVSVTSKSISSRLTAPKFWFRKPRHTWMVMMLGSAQGTIRSVR